MNRVAEKFLDGTGAASVLTQKERLALIGVHTAEAIGGAAMVGVGLKMNLSKSDLAGFLVIPGCFISGHGVIEGASNAYRAIRGTHTSQPAQ